ncbi:hypothetical protein [Streptosporangium lutulentum]|uniref:Peptidase inhibitor family I36 n=1 Tax=Streptosporangium lutulentum TaxID=1461250 RepID=A0ABT9Q963_9ACTN|nr:hypothetical protein [Streptosporangium lutulentum]MDP9842945.1 hypothetical protein [Streptosporangium lutulentum]
MNRRSTALAALGIAALALFATPGVAQAIDRPTPKPVTAPSSTDTAITSSSPDSALAAAPDGYLYAWVGANKGGAWCRWFNDDTNWDTCSGAVSNMEMRNLASSLENRGYTGSYDDVNLYYSPSYGGSRNCLPNGYYLNNLTGIYFLWDGKAGQGQSMNDNIASHRWANSC